MTVSSTNPPRNPVTTCAGAPRGDITSNSLMPSSTFNELSIVLKVPSMPATSAVPRRPLVNGIELLKAGRYTLPM